MSIFKDLKMAIYEEDRIEEVLDLLGCGNIHHEQGGLLVVASLPSGNNKRSVQIKNNENLGLNIRTRGGIKGDIFTLVSYIISDCKNQEECDEDLYNAKEWILDNLDYYHLLKNNNKKEEKVIVNEWLKKIKKQRRKRVDLEGIKPNTPIGEEVVKYYRMKPYQGWIEEGISYETQVEWEVGFCFDSHRIVVMLRDLIGRLIGIKGRTIDPQYKEKDIPKYIYLRKINKSIELFGLHKTAPHVAEKKDIILFEGFKSVFKSWQYGYKNCASIEGDEISPIQIGIMKSFGLDTSITLCYDKDKSPKEILEQAKKITNRKVYIIYDRENLLSEKDSPVDKGFDTWERLYSNRLEIDIFTSIYIKESD